MSFTLSQIFILGVGYLATLFACALLVEKKLLPQKLIQHPVVYVLAVGVYASGWAFYGSFGFAQQHGYAYLAYYLGIALAFVLAPIILMPVLRLARNYQLSSLADLLAFRYRSRWVGVLVTLGLLLSSLPLLALQIKTIGDVIYLLTNESSPYHLALVFCVVIIVFAILFGARHISLRQKHESLLVAIAFESLVKLVAFLALGAASLYGVFGGFNGLETWLAENATQLNTASSSLSSNQWQVLLLLFFATALTMPHIYHIIFTENTSEAALHKASWMLPVFLLLLALPVPIIYWAHQALGSTLPIEYASLALGDSWALLSFIISLAAASGSIIVITLALAPMVLNHLVLAVYQPPANFDLYYWLVQMRRLLIAALIVIGYLFYLALSQGHHLTTLGLAAFIGTLQFLPGTLAVIFWPAANRKGLIAGLIAGFSVWGLGIGLPLFFEIKQLTILGWELKLQGADNWYQFTLLATCLNLVCFVVISLLTKISDEEKASALACTQNSIFYSQRLQLKVQTIGELTAQLSLALGTEIAQREVTKALEELKIAPQDNRPYSLRRLRKRLQANLSGLMGSGVAQELVDKHLPWQAASQHKDIHLVELNLEAYQNQLTGLAKELDKLRLYHRQTLMHLPLGICTLGPDQEILMWNQAMQTITSIAGHEVLGSKIQDLPAPWQQVLTNFLQPNHQPQHRYQVTNALGKSLWLGLKKTLQDGAATQMGDTILLVEDQTQYKLLEEQLLHKERLASIGRLAAGVAHEIGNPVTGISSLAQNLSYDAQEPELVEQASNQILQLTHRITRIVQSLISFAHVGQHKDNYQFDPVNLKGALQEAINLISLSHKGGARNFTLECADNLYTSGDAQRLVQVFVNLLSNACDASPANSTIFCHGYLDGNRLTLDVHDQGQGIATEDLEHIFEPFYTTKQVGKGTGLGLALVYSIVQEHQGQIYALSPSPKFQLGSCFRCHLPLAKST